MCTSEAVLQAKGCHADRGLLCRRRAVIAGLRAPLLVGTALGTSPSAPPLQERAAPRAPHMPATRKAGAAEPLRCRSCCAPAAACPVPGSLPAPYLLPTCSLPAPYLLPISSLPAPYQLPTSSLPPPYLALHALLRGSLRGRRHVSDGRGGLLRPLVGLQRRAQLGSAWDVPCVAIGRPHAHGRSQGRASGVVSCAPESPPWCLQCLPCVATGGPHPTRQPGSALVHPLRSWACPLRSCQVAATAAARQPDAGTGAVRQWRLLKRPQLHNPAYLAHLSAPLVAQQQLQPRQPSTIRRAQTLRCMHRVREAGE